MATYKIKNNDWGGYTLNVRDARILFKNFTGRPTEVNPQGGKRTVSLVIEDKDLWKTLAEDGWRFRTQKISDGVYAEPFEELPDGKIACPFTELVLNYDANRPPKVVVHSVTNTRGELFDEDDVGRLDYTYLTNVKLSINPSYWNRNGQSGTKGYINIMHVTIDEDPFEEDYIDDDEEVPFEE